MQQLFLYIFPARTSWGTRTAQAGSPFPGGSFFSAPAEWGTRTASAGSPLTGGSFSAPAEWGTRTALACSPLTGGKFFAEPQRGDSPSADGGSVAAPAAGAKRKDNLRFSFLFELLPFPCLLARRKSESGDRFENRGTTEDFFSATDGLPSEFVLLSSLFAVSDTILLHRPATSSRRGITVPRNSLVWRLRKAPTI